MTPRISHTDSSPAPPGDPDIAGLARRGLSSLLGAAVSAVANLALIVIVTRGVGQETAGYFFAATSVFVVLESLCALGTVTGMVYFVARFRATGQHLQVPHVLRLALRPVTCVALLAAAVLFVCAEPLSRAVGSTPSSDSVTFLKVLALFLPCAVVYDVVIASTQGFHVMRPTVLLERVGRPLSQLVLLLIAVVGGVSWTLALGWAGPYLCALALALLALHRLIRADRTRAQGGQVSAPASLRPREFWFYTAPRGLASVAQLSLQRLDIILVAYFLGPGPAAVYTAATRFVVLGQLGSQAVALAVQPKFSELMALGDVVNTKRVYQTSTAWVIAITWPIHLVVGVSAPVLMQLFGDDYGGGRWVVVILAAAMLVATGCGMVTMLLVMAGRTAANLMNVLVALATSIALNLLLIPHWGILGAAVAWGVAIVLSNLLPLWQIHRAFGLNPFGSASIAVATLAFVALGLVPTLGGMISGSHAVVAVLLCLGGAGYAAGLWRLRAALELDELAGAVLRRLRGARS